MTRFPKQEHQLLNAYEPIGDFLLGQEYRAIKVKSFFTTTVLDTLVPTASSSTASDVFAQNPFFALSTKILSVYSDAIRQNMENMAASSARIIQQQTLNAWSGAAQHFSKTLAENAMASQQQAIARIAEANQQALGMWAWGLNPFKMQPMTGFTSWFPTMMDFASAQSKPKRVK